MSRLGRDRQRDQRSAERPPAPADTPIDVRVPEAGGDAGGASVDGVLVVAAPGEEIRHAVLNRLHRFALAAGRPVLATIHDERIGCVVQLRVDPDGSSHLAGKPVPAPRGAKPAESAPPASAIPATPKAPPAAAAPEATVPPKTPLDPATPAASAAPAASAVRLARSVPAPTADSDAPGASAGSTTSAVPAAPATVPLSAAAPEATAAPETPLDSATPAAPAAPAAPATAPVASAVQSARAVPAASEAPAVPEAPATRVLRPAWAVPDDAADSPAPAARVAAVPESSRVASGESAPTFVLRALPEPAGSAAPGTVAPPTGVFGPPPRMDAPPAGGGVAADASAPGASAPPVAMPGASEGAAPEPASVPAGRPAPIPALVMDPDPAPKPTPTPARGFDAVAEAVLGDVPLTAPGDATAPALLAEPTARINEAVKEGRTQDAARLAERSVAEASATLGPEHPEVLRLRELTAYIAYLSGDPGRAFRLSLDLARIHRAAGDPEAAYGNVQSAATAWRAVRDPEQGLELGHDLVGLWSELAAEAGPAADDAEQLESARTRMGRLTARARAHARAD